MSASPASLLSELATKPNAAELRLAGSARTADQPIGGPTPGAVLALYRLLVHVSGICAPSPVIVAGWRARDRAMVRQWAERELARKIAGADGCPSIAVPAVLASHWEVRR